MYKILHFNNVKRIANAPGRDSKLLQGPPDYFSAQPALECTAVLFISFFWKHFQCTLGHLAFSLISLRSFHRSTYRSVLIHLQTITGGCRSSLAYFPTGSSEHSTPLRVATSHVWPQCNLLLSARNIWAWNPGLLLKPSVSPANFCFCSCEMAIRRYSQ